MDSSRQDGLKNPKVQKVPKVCRDSEPYIILIKFKRYPRFAGFPEPYVRLYWGWV